MAKPTFDIEAVMKEFSDSQIELFLNNVGAIEINYGCSIGCDFCGVDAVKGLKEVASYDSIVGLVNRMKGISMDHMPLQYWRSDPLDWEENEKDYYDINSLFNDEFGKSPFISTAVPKGKEGLALELLLRGELGRISISHMNFKRLQRYFNEKFPVLTTHKFEVDDSKDMRRIMFTEKYEEPKENAWVDLVEELEAPPIVRGHSTFTRDGKKDPKRFQRIGKKNIGNLSAIGIACFHGGLLTKEGMYNVEIVRPSEEHPEGADYDKLTPDHFKVWDYWNHPYHNMGYMDKKCQEDIEKYSPRHDIVAPIDAADVTRQDFTKAIQGTLSLHGFWLSMVEAHDYKMTVCKSPAFFMIDQQRMMTLSALEEKHPNLPTDDAYVQRLQYTRDIMDKADKKFRPWLHKE